MNKIAVLTSGGDAPGMNAAIRAVTRSALDQGMTVYGVRQGWQGLVEGQLQQLNARDVGGIIQVGGTFLGTARSGEFREEKGRSKALRNLAQRDIDGVVVIGGNGSQTGSYQLSRLGVHVVGIPSTIDNDLYGTDITIGCDTAINVTLGAIDHLRTTGSSHNRAFLVETMGRDIWRSWRVLRAAQKSSQRRSMRCRQTRLRGGCARHSNAARPTQSW